MGDGVEKANLQPCGRGKLEMQVGYKPPLGWVGKRPSKIYRFEIMRNPLCVFCCATG